MQLQFLKPFKDQRPKTKDQSEKIKNHPWFYALPVFVGLVALSDLCGVRYLSIGKRTEKVGKVSMARTGGKDNFCPKPIG